MKIRSTVLLAVFVVALFGILPGEMPAAFGTEIQNGENEGMLEGIPACSSSFDYQLAVANLEKEEPWLLPADN